MSGSVLGLGVDVVDIPRFRAVLERRPTMAERLFSADELAYAATLTNPAPTLAGRFGAKEAVMKALGVGLGAVDWTDIAVLRHPGGRPELVVRGRAAALAAGKGVKGWEVSISHTATVASVTVLALS
ncbi:MAG TPA: holo-ACP synthase [Acidimicrobiales bacterium]|nr:holo-ACP synthase [Acidimicrobiales bacterium]